MHDAYVTPSAVVAGILCGSAVIVAARGRIRVAWRWPVPPSLDRAIRRAGWSETPERFLVLTLVRGADSPAFRSSAGLLVGPSSAMAIANAGGLAGGASWPRTAWTAVCWVRGRRV